MPSAYALGIVSRNSILDFGVAERLRAFRKCIFHKRGRRENILHNFLQGEVINGSSSLRERVFGAARRLRQTRNKS